MDGEGLVKTPRHLFCQWSTISNRGPGPESCCRGLVAERARSVAVFSPMPELRGNHHPGKGA
eukprot:15466225-Alexandrium_andersonii.AAC.1